MSTIQDLYKHHEKAIKVILSCENVEQLKCARNFCINMVMLHTKSAMELVMTRKIEYLKKIEESESLVNNALSDVAYKLRGETKKKYVLKSQKKNKTRNPDDL